MELSSIPVIFYLLFVKALCLVDAVTVHYLHWNTSNPIFRIDNTDHIVDVNQGNLPWEYDQLNIICPSYLGNRGGTKTSEQDVPEKYIIYNVSREEYDSCRISQSDPRVVAVCDKPDKQLQFTITFRYSRFWRINLYHSNHRFHTLKKIFMLPRVNSSKLNFKGIPAAWYLKLEQGWVPKAI